MSVANCRDCKKAELIKTLQDMIKYNKHALSAKYNSENFNSYIEGKIFAYTNILSSVQNL